MRHVHTAPLPLCLFVCVCVCLCVGGLPGPGLHATCARATPCARAHHVRRPPSSCAPGGPDWLDHPFVDKVLEVTSSGIIMTSGQHPPPGGCLRLRWGVSLLAGWLVG